MQDLCHVSQHQMHSRVRKQFICGLEWQKCLFLFAVYIQTLDQYESQRITTTLVVHRTEMFQSLSVKCLIVSLTPVRFLCEYSLHKQAFLSQIYSTDAQNNTQKNLIWTFI